MFPSISNAAASQYAMETIAFGKCGDDNCTEEALEETVAHLRQDMLEILVYYQDLQVEEVVMQKGYTTLALLCDIGE